MAEITALKRCWSSPEIALVSRFRACEKILSQKSHRRDLIKYVCQIIKSLLFAFHVALFVNNVALIFLLGQKAHGNRKIVQHCLRNGWNNNNSIARITASLMDDVSSETFTLAESLEELLGNFMHTLSSFQHIFSLSYKGTKILSSKNNKKITLR